MPWKETRVVDERVRFVLAVEAGEEPMAAVCRRFGISRQHGYKWLGALAGGRRGRASPTGRGRRSAIRRRWHASSSRRASRCGGRIRPGGR